MISELKILFENIKNFRGKRLLNEGVGDDAIIDAINNHEYIYLYYEGDDANQKGYRTVRPYVLGTSSAGNRVLRAWQDRGRSLSYSTGSRGADHDYWHDDDGKIKPGWRMFRVDKISHVYPTGKKFNKSDGAVMIPPQYREGSDRNMTDIIAYVSSKQEPVEIPTSVEKPLTGKKNRFMGANKSNRKMTADDVVKLYNIAKRVHKKSAGQYIVVINNNNEYELIDAKNKQLIPPQAIVGSLTNLYDTLVKKSPEDKFFKDNINKSKTEFSQNVENSPTIPFDKKTFFKQ